MVGIKNPAVDALIERMIFAKDRAEQIAACKAMDRVLLWNFYVRARNSPTDSSAMRAGIASAAPSPCPNTACRDFPTVWWYDADKAAKIGKRS